MNDRVARIAVRGLVAAAMAAGITAEIASHVVLDHGSGTFFGLLAFLPMLVLPGALAWRFPRPRYLALWATAGWFTTIIWMLTGTPRWFERELQGWHAVSVPLWITIALVIFIAPLVALVMGKPRELAADHEVFGARFRRVITITLVFATAVVVTVTAYGAEQAFIIGFAATALVVPGTLAYRDPRPRWAWLWVVWTVPFALLGACLLPELPSVWLVRMISAGFGTIFVLLLVALPMICLATPPGPFIGSSARAMYRTRSR